MKHLWMAGCLLLTALPAAAETVPAVARALAGPLAAGRRAEATLEYVLADPLGGPSRTVRGRVTVEAPDRVRLDLGPDGERIVLRGDGGEWLQPAARQLVRIPANRAASALMWWRALLPGSGAIFAEDSLAPRRFRLTPRDPGAAGLRVTVSLDPRGFPSRLAVEGGEEPAPDYRLRNWRLAPARGIATYRIVAPAGFDTVDLP